MVVPFLYCKPEVLIRVLCGTGRPHAHACGSVGGSSAGRGGSAAGRVHRAGGQLLSAAAPAGSAHTGGQLAPLLPLHAALACCLGNCQLSPYKNAVFCLDSSREMRYSPGFDAERHWCISQGGEKQGKVSKLVKNEVLMLNIGSMCTGACVVAVSVHICASGIPWP